MKTLIPFLLLLLIHHFLLTPLIRKRLPLYIGLTVALLVLFGAWCLKTGGGPDGPPPPPEFRSEMAPPPPPGFGEGPGREGRPGPMRPEVAKTIMGILLIGVDLGAYFYVESKRKERRMKELQAENLSQRLESLRYQINPHFFMNTLNNIHALVDIDPEKAKESMSEYVRIFLDDSDTPVVVLYSLKHLIGQLPADRFMRIHRSYIISLDHIAEASRTGVLLDNGIALPVGESYRPAFAEYLASRQCL